MPEEFDEFGIPIKKKRQQEVDEFGVPIKKKETGGIGSSVGALSGTGGAGLSASSGIAGKIKSKPTTKPRIEEIEAYNQRFRDITGTKSTQFTLGSELPQIKKAREEKDYLQFRQIEDNEINPVLSAVQSGTADPNQLKELYNKPYGKRVVQSAIEEVMPGASQYGLDADVIGSDRNWQGIAAKIQETNRPKGVENSNQQEAELNNELSNDFKTFTYGNERIGIEGKDEAVMKVDKNSFGEIDPNSFTDLEDARKKILRADKVWGANGVETEKKSLLKKIEARQFQLKAQEQLPEEIVSNAAMIKDAVSKVPVEWKRKGGNPELSAKDAEYVMEGLNYIRDSAPGEYNMIMASMAAVGKMSEQQYQDLVMLGRDINYYRKFKAGEYVEEDTRDFMTPQVKKAYLSGWLSQRLKEKRKSINTFKVSDKDILEAYKDAPEELKDDELLYELRRQEAVGSGGKGIRKTGGIYEFYHGIASPLKSVANTFDVAFDSPFEAYLKSKELDRGDQKIPQKGGGFGEDLPSNTWLNKAVGGFGSFLTQVMLARGIGAGTSSVGNTMLSMAAPRAATLTTGGMALKVGTPLSTLAQTYGDEFIDFLEKTGSPAKAGFGAFTSGLAQGYIERFVMPDVKIADNIGLLTSKRNFARDIINVVENGGGKAEIGKVVRDFVYNTTKTLGKEAILEENLQNLTNALTEQIISPKTAADRDLMQEIADVSSQSITAMAIPSLLGGAGETKVQRGLNKAQLHHIGVNYKTYQEALDRQLARGLMSKQDYEQASAIIQSHGENVKNAPVRDANGELISAARQLEYAYQSTVAEVAAQQAAKQPDKIQREPLEKKVEEADKIKRQIFYGEDDSKLPPKKDEPIVIDQDRDLMDEEEGSEFTSRPKEEILVDVPAAAAAIKDVNVRNQILSNPERGLAEIAQQLHSTEGEASTATKYFGRDLSDLALELYPTREDADAVLQQAAQPQIDQQRDLDMGTEPGLESATSKNTPYVKDISDFSNENEFYRVVVGDKAFKDIVENGVVRVGTSEEKAAKTKLAQETGAINLDRSGTTAYPSFSKGKASISYAKENPNNYIIVTSDKSIKPSTSGRHGKGTTMFPTNESGKHLEELDAKKVQVYKHSGDGKYELVYDNGQLVEGRKSETPSISVQMPEEVAKPEVVEPQTAETTTPTEPQAEAGSASKPTFENVPVTTRTPEEVDKAKNEVFNNLSVLQVGSLIVNSDGQVKVVTDNSVGKNGNHLIGVVIFERQPDGSLIQRSNQSWVSKDKDGKIKADYNPHETGTNSKGERVTVTDEITGEFIDLSKEKIFVEDADGNLVETQAWKSFKPSEQQKSKPPSVEQAAETTVSNAEALPVAAETLQPEAGGQPSGEKLLEEVPPGEPPPPPKAAEKESGGSKDKGILNRLYGAKNVPQAAKEGFEREGLEYQTSNQEEAAAVAKAIIESEGMDEAVRLASEQKFDGDVNSLILAESLNQLAIQEEKAATAAEKIAKAERFAEIAILYDKMARTAGRFNAAINYFYKKSPLGMILKENADRKDEFNKWAKPKEKSWKESFAELLKDPDFEAVVKEYTREELKKERAASRAARKEKVHKAIDEAAEKWALKLSAKLPEGTRRQGIDGAKVLKAVAASMKAAYNAGESVAKIVQDAIDYISEKLGTTDWGSEEFRKEWEAKLAEAPSKKVLTDEELRQKALDKFRKKLKGLTEEQKDEVIRKSYQELFKNRALDYEDFRKIIANATGRGDLTEEQKNQLKKLIHDTNVVDDFGKRYREQKTQKSRDAYKKAQERAALAARDLADMFDKKQDILRLLVTAMQGSTISLTNALLLNPAFNVINQWAIRLPNAIIQTVIDLGLRMFNKDYRGTYSTVFNQRSFFKQLGIGTSEAVKQIATGLNRQDYNAKEIYPNQIRPMKALRSLRTDKLTFRQKVHRVLQIFPGTPAEIIFRVLNLGDKPMRFGAEGAQASAFAKSLGIKPTNIDFDIFMEFPREEAYRILRERGLSEKEAGDKADAIRDAIVQEGKRSTFQQDNIFVDAINKGFGESGIGMLGKATLISPYIKIPSNAFWSFFNITHPTIALTQATGHMIAAKNAKAKGDDVKAMKQAREARYWLGHAAVGVGWNAAIIPLIKLGIIAAGYSDDESKKEREGEMTYEPQGTFNVTKFFAFIRGENPDDVKESFTINLKWFGPLGMFMNAKERDWEEMDEEQRENRDLLTTNLLSLWDTDDLSEMQNSVFSNASSLFGALGEGGYSANKYFLNQINMVANLVQPATIAQINRAQMPYYTQGKADSFAKELDNAFAQRSWLYRKLTGSYPPAKINIWGEPLQKDGSVWNRVLGFNRVTKDNFAQPLYEDAKKYNDPGFFPPAVTNKLEGQTLTAEQETKRKEFVGAARKALIAPFINDGAAFPIVGKKYSELTPEQKKAAIEYFSAVGREQGDAQLFLIYPELKPKTKTIQEEVSDDLFKAALEIMKIKVK